MKENQFWAFVDMQLQALCKAIDDEIAFVLPVTYKNKKQVVICYKNHSVLRLKIKTNNFLNMTIFVLKEVVKKKKDGEKNGSYIDIVNTGKCNINLSNHINVKK